MSAYSCNVNISDNSGPSRTYTSSVGVFPQGLGILSGGFSETVQFFHTVRIDAQNYRLMFTQSNGAIYEFSRLGHDYEAFIAEVLLAYNEYILASLFVEGAVRFKTSGECEVKTAAGQAFSQKAEFRLYDDSLCILPIGRTAVRIPLCFITDVSQEGYRLTVKTDIGDIATVAKIGYDTTPFYGKLNELMDAQVKRTAEVLLGAMPISESSAVRASRLLRERVCSPLSGLEALSPGFTAMFDSFAEKSARSAEYAFLREIGGGQTCVGIDKQADEEAPSFWLAVPFLDCAKPFVAVEIFSGTDPDAATYIYSIPGGESEWHRFWRMLNHAMEAVDFRKEPIYLPQSELTQANNERYALALRLIQPLSFLRERFQTRVIHRGFDSWKNSILKCGK